MMVKICKRVYFLPASVLITTQLTINFFSPSFKTILCDDDGERYEIGLPFKSTSLESLSKINVQRCYKSNNGKPTAIELAFSDASEMGYGAVVYIRTQFQSRIEVAFAIAKLRITIPRLEQNGALVAYRLISTVKAELDATINSNYLD